jgi:hypothetical protein
LLVDAWFPVRSGIRMIVPGYGELISNGNCENAWS